MTLLNQLPLQRVLMDIDLKLTMALSLQWTMRMEQEQLARPGAGS